MDQKRPVLLIESKIRLVTSYIFLIISLVLTRLTWGETGVKVEELLGEDIQVIAYSNPEEALARIEKKIAEIDPDEGIVIATLETVRAQVYNGYSMPDEALKAARRGIAAINPDNSGADQLSEVRLEIYAGLLISVANAEGYLGQAVAAKETSKKALDIARLLDNKHLLLTALTNYASILDVPLEAEQAIKLLEEAFRYAKELNDSDALGFLLSTTGRIYSQLNNYRQAINYHKQALEYYGEDQIASRSILLYNIASKYFSLKEYDNAQTYLERSRKLSEQVGNVRMQIYALILGARINLKKEGTQQALLNINQAEKLIQNFSDVELKINLYDVATQVYMSLGQFDKAEQTLHSYRAMLGNEVKSRVLSQWYLSFANLKEQQGDFEQAYQSLKSSRELMLDGIEQENQAERERLKKDIQIQASELEKERLSIQNIQQQLELSLTKQEKNKTIFIMAAILALLILLVYILILQWREKLRQRRNYQLLQEMDEAKSRFITNVSHEFRTAATLATGPLRELEFGDYIKQESGRELLSTALNNTKHMLHLLNQFLDVEKLESKNMPVRVKQMDVSTSLTECIERFQSEVELRSIELKTLGMESHSKFYFDPDHFHKIFVNLISNAIKYSPTGGVVEIDISEDKSHLMIAVSDQGPGIAKSEVPHVFDRFYQGKNSAVLQQPGTGIGLALVSELLLLHQGTIEIDSREGCGCRVLVKLKKDKSHYKSLNVFEDIPDSDEEPTDSTPSDELFQNEGVRVSAVKNSLHELFESGDSGPDFRKIRAINTSRQRVLVVDDNTEIRKLLRHTLEPFYQIDEAKHGEHALELIKVNQPDLIISDVMMPVMDGIELTSHLKSSVETAHIPLILLTAKVDEKSQVKGLDKGADDYVIKPFSSPELIARIGSHLAQKQRLAQKLYLDFQQQRAKPVEGISFESDDERFLQRLYSKINENLNNEGFTVSELSSILNLSQSKLSRKCKKLLNCSPAQLIKRRRLETSFELLTTHSSSVSEVAYAVGFQSLSAFSRAFSEHFGYPPTRAKSKTA
ncbi:MAG: response regulator [Gammaproteobacteria bacterium]|nr:response regulator [Gammaproteobacteria bacterium]